MQIEICLLQRYIFIDKSILRNIFFKISLKLCVCYT